MHCKLTCISISYSCLHSIVNPVTEGSAWSARADWTACSFHKFTTSRVLVTATKQPAHLSSLVNIKITYLVDIGYKDDGIRRILNIPTSGVYRFGGRNLTIYPATAQDVGATCTFDNGNRCLGHVYDPHSGQNCGFFILTRLLTK